MWPNAAIEGAVDSLWRGSLLQQYDEIAAVAESGIRGGQYFVWTILFLILSGFVFRRQCSVFFTWAGGFLKSPVRRTYYDTSPAVRYGLPVSFAVGLPLSAFLIYGAGAVDAPFYVILICLAAYFLLRSVVMAGVLYVSGEDGFITAVNRMACVFFMLSVVFFSLCYMSGMFVPGIFHILLSNVVPVVFAVLAFLYLVELVRIIFAYREPLLLSILYLCTLEILPMAIAVATVLKF